MENIDNFLTFEVKKDIADRYFGFRKIIEQDTSAYLKNVVDCSHELEQTIGHDLVRIYTLLDTEERIDRFIEVTGLPTRLFVDSYINTLPAREDIFTSQKFRGFTRKGCFANTFYDTYERLLLHVEDYRRKYDRLKHDHETIVEQIKLFYRKNDIETIFHFLRNLDGHTSLSSSSTVSSAGRTDMADKLRIHPPPPVEELLPDIAELPRERDIRKELRMLVTQACQQQPLLDLRSLKE